MKAYKGFNKDMTCREFQYEEGKTYVTDRAELCECGFHACENPLDCFGFYTPNDSVYHEVEVEDVVKGKNKLAAKKITIGKELTIKELVEAQIAHTEANNTTEIRSINSAIGYRSINSATGNRSANSATGNCSANSATGDYSANSAIGSCSANSATGYCSVNSATGNCSVNNAIGSFSVNSTIGDRSANNATGNFSVNNAIGRHSANSATGDYSANSTTGGYSANSATGYRSINSAIGDISANNAIGYGSANVSTGSEDSNFGANGTISVGWGKDNKCSGKIGAFLVLCERGKWDGSKYPLIGKPVLIEIDGKQYKEDTWYVLRDGKVVEYDFR